MPNRTLVSKSSCHDCSNGLQKCYPNIRLSKKISYVSPSRLPILRNKTRSRSRSRCRQIRLKPKPRKRQTAERKHRSGRVRRKDRTPVYALTIMGKILYSRIRRNSLVNRGVDLVRKISSCSLFGWSGRMLSSTKRVTKNSNCNIFRQKEVKVGFPPVTESKCSGKLPLSLFHLYLCGKKGEKV